MSQWRDVAELIESELDRIEGESMDAAQREQNPDAGTECAVDAIAALIETKAKVRLQVGPALFSFNSFQTWVNKASLWFRTLQRGSWVCIDQRGRICNSGKEFKRADRENAFPIVVYLIDPEAQP